MTRRIIVLTVCVFGFLLISANLQAQSKQSRLALIIGNGDYAHAPVLPNPANDAKSMTQELEKLGFKVIPVINGTYRQMKTAVQEFSNELSHYDVGVFYYSGHGVQYDGSNYLVPVDANIRKAVDIQFEAVNAAQVLADMGSSGDQVNIVILDACRNNPFVGQFRSMSRGLAVVQAPAGSMVVYSTAPDQVAQDGSGSHSPFTAALLQHIGTPGEEVNQMLTDVRREVIQETRSDQVPWTSSSLTTPFYFGGRNTGPGLLAIDPGLTGVQVTVDGEQIGTTPVQYQVAAGPHKVTFRDPRIESYDVTVSVAKGQTVDVTPQLKVKPVITLPAAIPEAATISINGTEVPKGTRTLYEQPGSYTIILTGDFIKPVTEKKALKYGESYSFEPKVVYRKGNLALEGVPSYVNVLLDANDVTKDLKTNPKKGTLLLEGVQAGPHTLDFTGRFVNSASLETTIAPDTVTTVEPKLQLFGELELSILRPREVQGNIVRVITDSQGQQYTSQLTPADDTTKTFLPVGQYTLDLAFAGDPSPGFQGKFKLAGGEVTTVSAPVQYSMQYLLKQFQSLRSDTSAVVADARQRRLALGARLQAEYSSQSAKLHTLQRKRVSRTVSGTILNILGIASEATAGFFYLGRSGAASAYQAATTPGEADAFGKLANTYNVVFLSTGIAGIGCLAVGEGLLLARPKTTDLERSLQDLDAQIKALGALQNMGF